MSTKTLTPQELAQFQAQTSLPLDTVGSEASHDSLSFFKRLTGTPATLEQWATEQIYQPGEVVFEEGEIGNALFLILSGQIAVITNRFRERHLLAVRGPGEVIGEMALVEECPRMGTVAALCPTTLLRISQSDFHRLIQSNPEFGLELMRILSGRLRAETNRLPAPSSDTDQRDALTGAGTRAAFDTRLHEMWGQVRQHRGTFSLLLADLDHFKSINDGFGHARGDEALKEFVRRAQTTLRKNDLLFRYGGDEFCVLLPDITGPQAVALAQRLLNTVRETPLAGTPPLTLTLSIGVASFPEDAAAAVKPEELLEVADHRAYHAKHSGRARVVGAAEIPGTSIPPKMLAPEISRLIERDQALETVRLFLGELVQERHGGLWVRGPSGCGQSRFLREVAANAHLQSYAAFTLSGAPALQMQPYGVVAAARQTHDETASVWPAPDNPTPFAESLARKLKPFVAERQKSGVLIILDQANWIDPDTWSGLQNLLAVPLAFPVGIAYAGTEQSMLGDGIYQREAVLTPLTAQGIRVWLRQSLGWEAPLSFAEQLRQTTGGCPAHLQREVARLVENKVLTLTPDGWMLHVTGDDGLLPFTE